MIDLFIADLTNLFKGDPGMKRVATALPERLWYLETSSVDEDDEFVLIALGRRVLEIVLYLVEVISKVRPFEAIRNRTSDDETTGTMAHSLD